MPARLGKKTKEGVYGGILPVGSASLGTCSFESDEVPAAFELRHDLIARTLSTHRVVYEVNRAIRDQIGPVLRAVINRDVRAEALHESNVVSTARCYDLQGAPVDPRPSPC